MGFVAGYPTYTVEQMRKAYEMANERNWTAVELSKHLQVPPHALRQRRLKMNRKGANIPHLKRKTNSSRYTTEELQAVVDRYMNNVRA